MIRIFLYNNAHFGDQVFSRPLYRMLCLSGAFEVHLGAARNHAYLFEDLVPLGLRLHVAPYDDVDHGIAVDLSYLCPEGCLPVSTWLGEYDDTRAHQWSNVVEVFERQLREHGVENPVPLDRGRTPMVDFARRRISPRLTVPAVYLDDAPVRAPHSSFLFDKERLLERYPGVHFLCTKRPERPHPRLLDGSRIDLRDLSALSEQCLAILGKGSGPFCCTYTEANRCKPRAVCGYRSEVSPTFWDYEGNPLRHLDTMDEVVAFLDEVLARETQPEAAAARAGAQDPVPLEVE